ncbi:MAG: DUF6402 family protein [Pseudomonadales bacterium]|nr:DUF6402 family protein [Pseudomonadales bacterium]
MSDLDITKIPQIMDKNNWPVGAALMRKWFSGKSNNIPAAGTPSLTDVKMDWLLSYSRAKSVYDGILSEKIWINEEAKKEIIQMLKRKSLLSNTERSFGTPKIPLPNVDRDYIQFRPVGGILDMAFGDMDDLRAALANFVFRIVVIGKVVPTLNDRRLPTGEYRVTISEVGIYARDSYDFIDEAGDDQPLGNWDFDDDSVGRTFLNGGVDVHNSDFRVWRAKNNKGGDFLVYSDIRYTRTNDSFTFRK